MDLSLLRKEKIITERVIVKADEIDNIKQIILLKTKNQLNGKRHREGFVIDVKEIIRMGDLVITKDRFNGQYHVDISLKAEILKIRPRDLIYGCKIKMVTKAGIFAENWNDRIKILIPSDELLNFDYHSKYKKNDKINVEVIAQRSTIYDNEVMVHGRIYYYKVPSRRKLLRKISYPIYSKSKSYSPLQLTELKFNKNPKLFDKSQKNVSLGFPWGSSLEYYINVKLENLDSFYRNLLNPYHDISNLNTADMIEIFRTFKFLLPTSRQKLNIFAKVYSNSDNLDYKSALDKLTTNYTLIKEPKNKINIGIFVLGSQRHHLELILYILKYKPEKLVINLDITPNLFTAEWLYLLSHLYKGLWMFKPRVSDQLSLRYYLIGNRCRIGKFDKSIIKNMFISIKEILKKITKNKYINSIIINVDLPSEFKQQLTHFNEYTYKLYMEKYQEILKISKMVHKDSPEITEYKKKQKEISQIWTNKYISVSNLDKVKTDQKSKKNSLKE